MEKAFPEFEDVWIMMWRYKSQAIDTDIMPTTHAISVKVQNTEQAFAYFDGISYGKGCAVLK
eukprot:CAMPEP_0201283440 /NCGR_PEP_ID=MMETSP1317-20130820/8551_1 /ASSEMBLY_ACC=CAM_ASM_000770 /TAXON_ID=187299 /ORGANISM="Undescribed Undescribed, Strain Undescribed" /LENGTH=61 /DNA_ID=CAMNT_0047599673 /DNA_START=274 /DNA_END=459 /DNA_ORIENTATION=+